MEKMYTKRGFLNAVIAKMNGVEAEEAWTNEIIAQYAAEMIEKMEEANAKRKTKVTEKQLENDRKPGIGFLRCCCRFYCWA